jgi:hypothetical protein
MENYYFVVGIITLLVAIASLYYQHETVRLMKVGASNARQRAAAATGKPWWQSSQVLAVLLLASLTWVPWVYGLVVQEATPLVAINYGVLPDGNYFIRPVMKDTKPGKKLIGLVFHWKGEVDILDTKGLQKSEPYDYTKGEKFLLITPDEQFRADVQRGDAGTNYWVLEVPDNIDKTQFSTIRQAQKLGAKIVSQNSKTP